MIMDKDQVNLIKAYNMLLYFSGSMIMYEPVEECVVDFWSKGILKSLPVKSANPRFMKAASQLRESCSDTASCQMKLKKDFMVLFADPAMPLAPACARLQFDAVPAPSH